MSNESKSNGPSPDWLIRMAEFEDSCQSVSAGGDIVDMDVPREGENV